MCSQVLTWPQNRFYTKFQFNRHLGYFSFQGNFVCARNYLDQRRGFRHNRSTADPSAFDTFLREIGNRMGQFFRFVYLKRGYDAVRREVLCEVSYNILFEFVIFLQLGRFIKMLLYESYDKLHIDNTLVIYRVIHKSLREFRTRLSNNPDRHDRKKHINR